MPQKTNLNVSPYFDDFDPKKNYKRVLFKPGTTVQARELTTLQSSLQNQIESFGDHFFNNGDKVIPGNLAFIASYDAVLIDPTFRGLDVSDYGSSLIGRKITGKRSGVTAKVRNYITAEKSSLGFDTLYIKYISASKVDNTTKEFLEDEDLILSSGKAIKVGNNTIKLNSSFANTTTVDASRSGSAATIDEGVYFIRGFFVNVKKQTIILDQYSNTPTYRIGFLVDEQIVTAYDDPTLFDNAKGYSNFSAPGADRLQISVTLIKKPIDDFNDDNFIELLRVVNGQVQSLKDKRDDENELREELARRTYDESGDYTITPFRVSVRNTVDDYISNNGLYDEGEITSNGNTASDDLFTLRVSPGKAYVRGFEIEKKIDTYIDAKKPRTIKTVNNTNYTFKMGNKLVVNNVYGTPIVGLGTTAYVSLRNKRNATAGISTGIEIGQARLYDFKINIDEGSHKNKSTKYETYFIDVHTYTVLELGGIPKTNGLKELKVPCKVEGSSSGARGYLAFDATTTTISLSDVSGTFIKGEKLIFDESTSGNIDSDKSAFVKNVTDYRIGDVHSIEAYGSSGVIFTADTLLDVSSTLDVAGAKYSFSAASSGISTVTSTKFRFSEDKIRIGDIITYDKETDTLPTFNEVKTISDDGSTITIQAVSSVSDVCVGSLPASATSANDLRVLRSTIRDRKLSDLLAPLPKNFISNVDLSEAQLTVRKQYNVTVNGAGSCSATESDPNLFFEPFEAPEDYMLFDASSGGNIETITSKKITVSEDAKTVTISGITSVTGVAKLTATLKKNNVVSKKLNLKKCETLTINGTVKKSSSNGLTSKTAFGTRVEDDTLSLNYPDVLRVHSIFESADNSNPVLPNITLTQISGNLTGLSVGEVIYGNTSTCRGLVVSVTGSNQVNFVLQNNKSFTVGETVTFKTSRIVGNVASFSSGSKDIRNNYGFDNGQKDDYCDFSRLTRKDKQSTPKGRLTIVYDRYEIDQNQVGDFITVNSYSPDDYSENLPTIKKYKASDWLDFRPRVAPFSGQIYSPFQFESRDFSGSQATIPNILVTNKNILLSYSYYLGRVDKLSLNKQGEFELKIGEPAEILLEPPGNKGEMEIASIYLPPYLFSSSDARVTFPSYRRYTMEDIGRLEDRIKNLEYYTQLSLLEIDTASLVIKDEVTGLDRFKCGFFVDNFKSHAAHDLKGFKASIDMEQGLLRPSHHTTGVDLFLGGDIILDPNEDQKHKDGLISPNIRKTGDLVTLDYTVVDGLESKFATRSISVNPFDVENWIGRIELNPFSDCWIEEKQVSADESDLKADYSVLVDIFQDDPDPGFVPIDWKSWVIYHTGIPNELKTKSNKDVNNITLGSQIEAVESPVSAADLDVYDANATDTIDGVQYNNVPSKYDTKVANKLINESVIKYMRSRNVEFDATRLKPFTQFYAFFSGKNITKYCLPKLVEVQMISGTFKMGETIYGEAKDDEKDKIKVNDASLKCRLADPRHKEGPYYKPTLKYTKNPYNTTQTLPGKYSTNTTILNIDTGSLGLASETRFSGWIEKGMVLYGESSKAKCKVTNVRLISDVMGGLIGSFFIPKYERKSGNPRFTVGTKSFRLSTSSKNADTDTKAVKSIAEALFESRGVVDSYADGVFSIRGSIFSKTSITDGTITASDDIKDDLTGNVEKILTKQPEPLGQTFKIDKENGVFLRSVELFFKSKPLPADTAKQKKADDDEDDDALTPITVSLRYLSGGKPGKKVVPFSEVTKIPSQVKVSNNASDATTFTFQSPVYLEGNGKQYALVLSTSDDSYDVWISRHGEDDVTKSGVNKVVGSKQPLIMNLYRAKLGGAWTSSTNEDLKFKFNYCKFKTPGTVKLYNSQLDYDNYGIVVLKKNPLLFLSRQSLFEFKEPIVNAGILTSGVSIKQDNTGATGKIVITSGSVGVGTTSLIYNNAGIGLTPVSGVATYTSVSFVSIPDYERGLPLSKLGKGLVGDITVTDGTVTGVNVSSGGTSYNAGDVVLANIGVSDNVTFTVGIVSAINAMVVEDIQGNFSQNDYLKVVYSDGSTVGFGTTNGMSSDPDDETERIRQGVFFKVYQPNHGMHSRNNKVELNHVSSDGSAVKLTQKIADESLNPVYVENVSIFTTFENVGVSSTNPGYFKVGNEIIKYTECNSSTNTLTIVERGVKDGFNNNTPVDEHAVGKRIRKYEIAGVSLFRINTTHDFANVDVGEDDNEKADITLDSYYLKINRNSGINKSNRTAGSSLGPLFIRDAKFDGGKNVRASKNIQYETLTPIVETFQPPKTSIAARARTFTATSVGTKKQVSFVDQGFDAITLNAINTYNTPRIITSIVNENTFLTDVPGRRSLNIETVFNTNDTDVSPVIDLDRMFAITTTNRINSPYNDDSELYLRGYKVKSINDDKHDCVYLTKVVRLETSATSLKVQFAGFRPTGTNFRVYYKVFRSDVPSKYQLFRGFNGDGRSDKDLGTASAATALLKDYDDYTYTVVDLPEFSAFQVKIVMISNNQAVVPFIKDLRILALF